MDKLTDNYIEFHALNGTPPEKVLQYQQIVNDAYREDRMMVSKRWGKLMEVTPRVFWAETFGGQDFVVIHWETIRFQTAEEYWKDEDVIE